MICVYCEKEFNLNGHRGGQNRLLCYNCLPEGLEKYERDRLKEKLFREKANQNKIKRGCDICGYNKYAGVLEWHHRDPFSKQYDPSNIVSKSYIRYQEEIKKCMLLCANCHREWHIEHDNIGA